MTWGDYDGDPPRVVQQKTATKRAIAAHPDPSAILAGTKRAGVAIRLTDYGKPFPVAG
ncbi:hypothetical protein [Methylobacterium sp. JK268]